MISFTKSSKLRSDKVNKNMYSYKAYEYAARGYIYWDHLLGIPQELNWKLYKTINQLDKSKGQAPSFRSRPATMIIDDT